MKNQTSKELALDMIETAICFLSEKKCVCGKHVKFDKRKQQKV